MRKYVDVNHLIEIFNDKANMASGTPKAVFLYAANMLSKLPPADVTEVKHGKWLKWEQMFHTTAIYPNQKLGVFCSACKKYADNDFDYCPNCGAKMDGGKENA